MNPIFKGWATVVVDYSPAPGPASAWKNADKALGPATGDNFDIVSLSDLYSPSSAPATGANPPFGGSGTPYMGDLNNKTDGFGFIGFDSPGNHPGLRFDRKALVFWCDGHVSVEALEERSVGSNPYGGDVRKERLGWFGPDEDNGYWNPAATLRE